MGVTESIDLSPQGLCKPVAQQIVKFSAMQGEACTPLDPDGGQQGKAGHG
jgi:hypothetical protein